jgi:hypothetical protein
MDTDFKAGDKVRTIWGDIRTVLYVEALQIWTGCNTWFHPSKVWKVKAAKSS